MWVAVKGGRCEDLKHMNKSGAEKYRPEEQKGDSGDIVQFL